MRVPSVPLPSSLLVTLTSDQRSRCRNFTPNLRLSWTAQGPLRPLAHHASQPTRRQREEKWAAGAREQGEVHPEPRRQAQHEAEPDRHASRRRVLQEVRLASPPLAPRPSSQPSSSSCPSSSCPSSTSSTASTASTSTTLTASPSPVAGAPRSSSGRRRTASTSRSRRRPSAPAATRASSCRPTTSSARAASETRTLAVRPRTLHPCLESWRTNPNLDPDLDPTPNLTLILP